MALLDYLVAFIPMLGILIFIHELGHFLAAKACGVRVLKFSLGFGSPVGFGRYRMRWERGGTEYVVAWIPLGGFVKMLGENLEIQGEEPEPAAIDARPDEFLGAKSTWQKLSITFAGPLMNLAFPVFVLVVGLMLGLPRAANVIGTVDPESPAALAGLAVGDRIVSVGGEPVRFWDDVDSAVRAASAGPLEVEVERGDTLVDFSVEAQVRSGLSDLGVAEPRGWIGVQNERLQPLVGIPDPSSPAGQAGLQSGDLVVQVGDQEVGDWNALVGAVEQNTEEPLVLAVRRGADAEEPIELALPAGLGVEALGVLPATVLIAEVSIPSAAEDAGLLPGDLLLSVDDSPIGSFGSFAETVRSSEGRALELVYAREGVVTEVAIAPRLITRESGLANLEEEVYQIGVRPHVGSLPGEYETEQYANPLLAFPRAFGMTVDITRTFLKGLAMLATGGVETSSLTGPIGIAQIARDSLDRGWWAYFGMMMLISINLGVLNLLPIPVLDGGQALIYMVEGVKRSPISLRSRELVQSFGLMVLFMLMGLAMWNDVARNWSDFIDWLIGGL
jgi:regulator of sigma E protease